jgi:ubiquinol-cytochrome c reductase cytochrome c1 subunit
MRRILLAAAAVLLAAGTPAIAADDSAAHAEIKLPQQNWSYESPLGTFDRTALRRGMQVYMEVCSTCHTLNLLAYRHLTGAGLTEDETKAVAATVEIEDGPNDTGDMFTRPGRPTDRFHHPFANPQAARAANNGALPPDLSLITKARKDGSNYLYALLIGYRNPPAGFALQEGMIYNDVFPGHQIKMPPPLSEGRVSYPDNTPATVENMARDVTTFLAWASEPELEARKRMGIKVLLFLLILTGILFVVKKKVWSDIR